MFCICLNFVQVDIWKEGALFLLMKLNVIVMKLNVLVLFVDVCVFLLCQLSRESCTCLNLVQVHICCCSVFCSQHVFVEYV